MRRGIASTALLLAGVAIFLFGSPYSNVLPTNRNPLYNVALTTLLLLAYLLLRRSRSLSDYAPAAYSLFAASAALLLLSTGILNIRMVGEDELRELALDKLSQFLHIVPAVLALALIAGRDLRSLFVARGNLRSGLLFGGLSFIGFAILAYLMQARSLPLQDLGAQSLGLILAFVLLNGTMEELWLRAIFLKPYQAVIGRTAAILVTSLVFSSLHLFATYDFPGGPVVFGLVTFGLGWAGAHVMLKTDSLIGPVLFHAGYDLVIIAPILASM